MIKYNNYPRWAERTEQEITSWLNFVAKDFGASIKKLDYNFKTDTEVREINIDFLEHDYNTDIITFDYGSQKKVIGEVHMSLDTVMLNAETIGEDCRDELDRVIVHGLLHLLGLNDSTDEEKSLMREKEDYYLLLRSKILD